jgi:hypothetical protein
LTKKINFDIIFSVRYNQLRVVEEEKMSKSTSTAVKTKSSSRKRKRLTTVLAPLPKLPELIDIPGEDLTKQVDKIRQGANEARNWVLWVLPRLERLEVQPREAREMLAKEIKAARESLQNLYQHSTPAYRRAAWLARFQHEFSRKLSTHGEVKTLLEGLVNEGILEEDPAGALETYKKHYSVSSDCKFEEPEIAAVKNFLTDLLNRVWREVGKSREQKTQELLAQKTIDWQELLRDKTGKYVVSIPKQRVSKNGETFWRGGGTLLVKSEKGKIFPLGASGAIERGVEEAKKMGIHLLVRSLQYDSPPFVEKLPEDQRKKVQFLWHILKRGIQLEEEAGKMQSLQKKLSVKTTVTPEKFFLEGAPGTCLAILNGIWVIPEGNHIRHLFFLATREEKEGSKKIRLAEVPDHLKDYLADCLEEYPEEGERFKGIPYPLNAVLQAIYGQILNASRDANKAKAITKH